MGIFGRKKISIEDIVSVVILEQTQNYRKKTRHGLIFGNNIFSPDAVFMENAEPAGVTYTFSVTLKDGSKEIVKADSGTSICDQLLQKALDDESIVPMDKAQLLSDKKKAPELQKNQLPNGLYKVGRDIPRGIFDFHHVWGSGTVGVYTSEKTVIGNQKFSEMIGDTLEYEKLDCIHVVCEEGWYVSIYGNLIVSISRSKDIEVDL